MIGITILTVLFWMLVVLTVSYIVAGVSDALYDIGTPPILIILMWVFVAGVILSLLGI